MTLGPVGTVAHPPKTSTATNTRRPRAQFIVPSPLLLSRSPSAVPPSSIRPGSSGRMGSTLADPGSSTSNRIPARPTRHIAEAAARPPPLELDRSMGSTSNMDSTGTTAPRVLSLRKRNENSLRGDVPSRRKDDLPKRRTEVVPPKRRNEVVLPKRRMEVVPPRRQKENVPNRQKKHGPPRPRDLPWRVHQKRRSPPPRNQTRGWR
jgi:hypothetical protein